MLHMKDERTHIGCMEIKTAVIMVLIVTCLQLPLVFVSGDWYCYWAPSYSVQSSHDFGCNLYITLCYCALSLLPHIPLHHHYYDHTTNLFQNRNNTSPKNYEVEIPGVYYVALALGIVCLILDIQFYLYCMGLLAIAQGSSSQQ